MNNRGQATINFFVNLGFPLFVPYLWGGERFAANQAHQADQKERVMTL